MSKNKSRSMILAIGAAAIVMAGAYSGASLKTDSDKKQVIEKWKSESNEERIAQLEASKAVWERQRQELLRKIEQIDARKNVEQPAKTS